METTQRRERRLLFLRLNVCLCVVILHARMCAHWGQSPVTVYWSSLFQKALLSLLITACSFQHTHTLPRVVGGYKLALHLLQLNLGLENKSYEGHWQAEQWVLGTDASWSVKPSFLVTLYHILSTPAALSPQKAVCQWQHGSLGGPCSQPLTRLIRQTLRESSQAYAWFW